MISVKQNHSSEISILLGLSLPQPSQNPRVNAKSAGIDKCELKFAFASAKGLNAFVLVINFKYNI